MAGLLPSIFVAAVVGAFRPYLNGVTRKHFAVAALIAFVGGSFYSSQSPTVTTSQPANLAPEGQSHTIADRAVSHENPSAFERKRFDRVSIALPRNWRWMGGSDAQSLNTNSEALTDSLGIGVGQGNNTILAAGNAFNDAHVSVASMRLSVRTGPTFGQADLQEALKEPHDQIDRELQEAAEKTAAAMRKLPQVSFYNVTGGGIRQSGNVACAWTGFEYDIGKGVTVSDLWVCPASGRTVKLSTSYAKGQTNLFAATIDHIWRSLLLEPVL